MGQLRLPRALMVGSLLAAGLVAVAHAQPADMPPLAARDGQVTLPYAEQKFRGSVGTTYLDSDAPQFPAQVAAPEGAPNVLLVLLDDVGFGQFGVTGGGVPSPTRAALLTGRNHNVAGTGVITELATGYDGYTGIIPKDTATVAEILEVKPGTVKASLAHARDKLRAALTPDGGAR